MNEHYDKKVKDLYNNFIVGFTNVNICNVKAYFILLNIICVYIIFKDEVRQLTV